VAAEFTHEHRALFLVHAKHESRQRRFVVSRVRPEALAKLVALSAVRFDGNLRTLLTISLHLLILPGNGRENFGPRAAVQVNCSD